MPASSQATDIQSMLRGKQMIVDQNLAEQRSERFEPARRQHPGTRPFQLRAIRTRGAPQQGKRLSTLVGTRRTKVGMLSDGGHQLASRLASSCW